MKTQFITFPLIAAAIVTAGCGDGNSSPSQVQLTSQERSASYLTDASGMALYVFDNDTAGVSNCTGDCLTKWPKFLDSSSSDGDIALISDDHSGYLGHPLYYWFQDTVAGDTNGDGVNGVWHLAYPADSFAATDQTKLSSSTKTQHYLGDSSGMTLYTFDNDTDNVSNCAGDCLVKWPVFYADLSKLELPDGVSSDDFGTITRSDGVQQTTYRSQPLYYYFEDTESSHTKGDWKAGVWHLVEL